MSSINAASLARYPRSVLDGRWSWLAKYGELEQHARQLEALGFHIDIKETTHEAWCRAYVALLESIVERLSN